jgi:hypothetical protein
LDALLQFEVHFELPFHPQLDHCGLTIVISATPA